MGQWIWETMCWVKEETLFGELADWEDDGRLTPQNNHLIGIWMPASLIDQRERNDEEPKSKGRVEREMQWGSKVKGSSVLQNITKGMSSLQKGCANLFYSQVIGTNSLSMSWTKALQFTVCRGAGSSRRLWSVIIITKASQRNSFQHGVRIASSLQQK